MAALYTLFLLMTAIAAPDGFLQTESAPVGRDTSLASLIEAERSFSRASERSGMKSAFLEFFDDSCVVFRPGPVNGREAMRARPDPPVTLTWEPVEGCVSADGLFGYTTGPWTSTPKTRAAGEPHHGHYFSVWERLPPKPWSVVLDIGTGHEQPGRAGEPRGLRTFPACTKDWKSPFSRSDAVDTVAVLEHELGSSARSFEGFERWSSCASDSVRFFRPGRLPVKGLAEAERELASLIKSLVWSPLRVRASGSGDMAYAYGSYTVQETAGEKTSPMERGFYVHLWMWEKDAGWRIVAEIHSPE